MKTSHSQPETHSDMLCFPYTHSACVGAGEYLFLGDRVLRILMPLRNMGGQDAYSLFSQTKHPF